jgi:hypothetical protein
MTFMRFAGIISTLIIPFFTFNPRLVAQSTSNGNRGLVRPGEIMMGGKISRVEGNRFHLDADALMLPDGKVTELAEPRLMIVLVTSKTDLFVYGSTSKKLAMTDLKAGDMALVIGQDPGREKEMPARAIGVRAAETDDPLITGEMPLKWEEARWENVADEPILILKLKDDSDWKVCKCSSAESLSVLVLYIRDGKRGEAATPLVSGRPFKAEKTSFQSVIKPNGRDLDFIFSGGNLDPGQDILGAVAQISGSDQVDPAKLQKAKEIRIRLAPKLYSPTLRLEGEGRIAFALQKGPDGGGQSKRTISNIIEVPVHFGAARGD